MKQYFDEILKAKEIMILDGPTATELESLGCDLNDKLWSAKVLASQPELFKVVHKSYFDAGADCGVSGSYQATIDGFMQQGYTLEESEDLIRKSITILKEVREEWWQESGQASGRVYPLVCASVGPYGAFLADGSEYRGGYSVNADDLKKFHKRRMELLLEAGADILAVETIPCLEEAVAVVELLEDMGNGECWVCFSCKNATDISDGTKIAKCAETLNTFDTVKAIGINCTAPEFVGDLIKAVKANTNKPIIVYPNSGDTYDPITKTWTKTADQKSYLDFAKEWMECGATIIGGCCQTTPKEIQAIYDFLKA